MISHVRRAGAMRSDKRFRSQLGHGARSRTNVNHHGTLCGEAPSSADIDKEHAAHLRRCAKAPALSGWLDDVCPGCLALVPEVLS